MSHDIWETTPLKLAMKFGLILEHNKNRLQDTLLLTVTVFSIPNFQVDRVKITYSDCFCSPKGCHCNHQPLHSTSAAAA